MKKHASALTTLLVLACLIGFIGNRQLEFAELTIQLIDDVSGKQLSGLICISDEKGNAISAPQLLTRGMGLSDKLPISRWSVVPKQTTITLPRKKLTIEAISGLETELRSVSIDLTRKSKSSLTIPLTRFYNAASKGYRSANTHLHLQKISRDDCDRYLLEIPKADGLDGLFLSYLERAGADREYISNKYTDGDLVSLTKKSGIPIGNGEEHRHNFAGFGQGFGHVMLLNIKKLIQPVSIGPGIMKIGTDGIPLQRGINTARKDGATIIWCHNNWGMEAVPNFLTGRVDAQNIFDGGTHGSFKDSFYRYLNIGLKVPFSTGTDWFMYDFSRVYCDLDGDVTIQKWLDSLSKGKNYITNGPLLEFEVGRKSMGQTIEVENSRTVLLKAKAAGRTDFGRIEIIRNGNVIDTLASRKVGEHFEAERAMSLKIDSPCWLALRTPPPAVKDHPDLQQPNNQNLLGRELFAHTSAVYIEVDGRSHFDSAVARKILAEMKANRKFISEKATFSDSQERARVLDVYSDGIEAIQRRIKINTQ